MVRSIVTISMLASLFALGCDKDKTDANQTAPSASAAPASAPSGERRERDHEPREGDGGREHGEHPAH